jgi:hypothetical protein
LRKQRAEGKTDSNSNYRLAELLEQSERYAEAIAEYSEDAVKPSDLSLRATVNPSALQWSICKRRLDAMQFCDNHPDRIMKARRTPANLNGAIYNSRPRDGRTWLKPSEVVDQMSAMGPGALAFAFHDYFSHCHGDDCSAYAQITAAIGGEQDIPVLIEILERTTDRLAGRNVEEYIRKRLEPSEVALHAVLEKLSGIKNPAMGRKERLIFWIKWWDDNAARIVKPGKVAA